MNNDHGCVANPVASLFTWKRMSTSDPYVDPHTMYYEVELLQDFGYFPKGSYFHEVCLLDGVLFIEDELGHEHKFPLQYSLV